jgi:lipoprotein-releasing system permease protein
MLRPLSLSLGLRYTRAKRKNHFISFISTVSIIGIALGVAVLITVLSVMNGFDVQIKKRILEMVPQVTVTTYTQKVNHWKPLAARLVKEKHIVAAAPFVQGQGMLSNLGHPAFVVIEGVNPKLESKVSPIATKVIKGSLSALVPGKFGVVVGQDLANNLGLRMGSHVMLYVPKSDSSPFGMLPRMRQFTVVGIFHVGYQYDSGYALINIKDAQALWQMGTAVTGVQLKLTDLFLAPKMTNYLNRTLPPGYESYSWVDQNANFFRALKMEKVMMFLILVLIIAVAAFNMLASLVMLVTDKQADIAILKTLGATRGLLVRAFMISGVMVGLFGTLLGTVFGVVLSLNVTSLVNAIQTAFGVQFLNASVYYINYLPSHLDWSDVLTVVAVAVVLSFLATIYPAIRASKVAIAEALSYE